MRICENDLGETRARVTVQVGLIFFCIFCARYDLNARLEMLGFRT